MTLNVPKSIWRCPLRILVGARLQNSGDILLSNPAVKKVCGPK